MLWHSVYAELDWARLLKKNGNMIFLLQQWNDIKEEKLPKWCDYLIHNFYAKPRLSLCIGLRKYNAHPKCQNSKSD